MFVKESDDLMFFWVFVIENAVYGLDLYLFNYDVLDVEVGCNAEIALVPDCLAFVFSGQLNHRKVSIISDVLIEGAG